MSTLAELFCRQHKCLPVEFERRIFWRTLHPHAVPVAPLLLLGNYFESDRSLLEACGRATSLAQVHEEIQIHPAHPHHGRWLHRYARLRISTRRLRRLAENCFHSASREHVRRRVGIA